MAPKNTPGKDKAPVGPSQQTRSQAPSSIAGSQHAPPFIAFDGSNAETAIQDDMEVWKERTYALNRETDRLVEVEQRDKSEIQQLKAQLQALTATTANVATTAPSIATYSERPRYHKIPDPPVFTDGKDPTWENWSLGIREKLAINVDTFPNELYKLSYIHSRLAGGAAEVTQARRDPNCDNLYLTANELLEELAQSFHDPDKKDNYRREYINLVQESKKFSDFFNQFQRLYTYLKYQEDVLVADLKDKINPRLRTFWTAQVEPLTKLSDIRNYLIRLNNEHRAVREIKDKLLKRDDSKITISRATIAVQPSAPKPDWSKPRSAVLTSAKDADVLAGTCFVCHKSGHSSRECPDRPIKVNAVDEDYDRSELDTESESESKN